MSSRYPVLENRPIDQWKVTELKEELKRRRLPVKGLKDDLIRRLDEDLRREAAEASKKDDANGADIDPQPVGGAEESQAGTVVAVVNIIETGSETGTVAAEVVNTIETGNDKAVDTAGRGNIGITEPIERENNEKIPEVVGIDCNKNEKLYGVSSPVDANVSVPVVDQEVPSKGLPDSGESKSGGEEQVNHNSTVESSITVSGSVLTEVGASGQDSYLTETQKENGDSAAKLENEESNAQLEYEDQKSELECDIEPQSMDLMVDFSAPKNQVSEVNPSLGSQVKSDSISSDSVSINEKNELKDNIIADNVKLEQDNVRPEVLESSSNNFVPVNDETHPMDVGDPHKEKTSLEEKSDNITSSDLNKSNGIDDAGDLEKLNLDRSSGEDSMEEDLQESKQFDSTLHDEELRNKRENSEVPIVKEESDSKDVGDVSAGKGFTHQDSDIHPSISVEKRKFTDHALPGNNEPAKRLRRWNTEIAKGPAPQSTPTSASTPKDEPMALKRNFSMSNSSAVDESPIERIVPPPQRSPTNSLRIDRFLRPFTLKAVHELLGKTGKVVSFWMDQIKTHCYVTYSSVDEAIETRNAVYNLQWPPNGGRLLLAEFVESEEVKMKLEAPPVQAAPVSSAPVVPPTPPTAQPEPSPRRHQEQRPIPVTLPPPPPLSKPPPAARERLPSPPPLPEKVDPPIVTLDDLFRKTRATPRIYYLPLSEEQVATKLEAQGKITKQ